MPAETTDSDVPQEAFPFMQLPPELHVMVYKFALQDIVDPILSSDSRDVEEPKPFHGALALLHTSELLRTESLCSMKRIVYSHRDSLLDARQCPIDRMKELTKATPIDWCALDEIVAQHDKLKRQHDCIDSVAEILHRVLRFQLEICYVRPTKLALSPPD
jgi:hypothetical protein